jgi:hypothetical protein
MNKDMLRNDLNRLRWWLYVLLCHGGLDRWDRWWTRWWNFWSKQRTLNKPVLRHVSKYTWFHEQARIAAGCLCAIKPLLFGCLGLIRDLDRKVGLYE